ncbi:hypothetical protein TCAL_08135 [Tigriopus californicus]|uniref:Target of rapamycin complex 2 subunit MAPKAP1 n=1 Tax=Tigriopus californicus TaxID=6832 RepID=A0A553PJL5_TIGCA|nr:target of rapamycin complex 2 subunit MAPKAP1-like [Tigriopus californicus]TRY77863.1 hypothetical protein TCAL_08135 [Tigriopus californicus]|eukprot:TCALIF_08135-PA protein Name:"Similar to MAPKAP1 Target of rapamycin complex 2 subunit MAPKAP1 (Gallus gallus)" AED:0.01 eAED:0.01 QI:71/1/1/1/0.75/0.6/5/1508/537
MALYDDPGWLLSHIAHSFVLSDETGACEQVMTAQDAHAFHTPLARVWARQHDTPLAFLQPLEQLHAQDDFEPHSYDIRIPGAVRGGAAGAALTGSTGFHRPRSNTEIKLEKMRRDKRNLPKVKTIHWKAHPHPLRPEEIEALFPIKTLPDRSQSTEAPHPVRSLLAYQLEHAALDSQHNPFSPFARFDAKNAGLHEKTRKIQIYPEMAWAEDRGFPVIVHVLATAKVTEVIGYACWKYTEEGRQPPLVHKSHEKYTLYMAEPDGTIEREFPPLEKRELISKYGFNILGLVDLGQDGEYSSPADRTVTVILPEGTFTVMELDTLDIPVKELLARVLARRKIPQHQTFQFKYIVERKDGQGEALDEEALLSSFHTKEFYILRANSRRKNDQDLGSIKHQDSDLEDSVYREYHDIQIRTKLHSKTDVTLGISEDKFEVYPKEHHSSARFWKKQKSVSFDMESIVACEIVEEKPNGKSVFRIVFQADHGYKRHDFECEGSAATKIHAKINHVMNLHPHETREEYQEYKERKIARRHTWLIK